MSISPESLYFKDMKSYVLTPGSRQEQRFKAPYKSRVILRIFSDEPVSVSLAGPHIEQQEITGSKEYSFTVEPGTEFLISILNRKVPLFSKTANVTLEIEMYGPKKAIDIYERVKNALTMLQEEPDFWHLQKDNVKDLLKEVMDVWSLLGDEGKGMVKELMALIKKLEKQE